MDKKQNFSPAEISEMHDAWLANVIASSPWIPGNEYILIIRHTPNSYDVVILPSTDLIKSLFSFLEDGPAVEDFEMEGYCNEFNKSNVPASPYVKFEIKLTV